MAWTGGDARLRILSGTLQAPQANGFLVVEQGGFAIENQQISDLNTFVVFDFVAEVQSLQAGESRTIGGPCTRVVRPTGS